MAEVGEGDMQIIIEIIEVDIIVKINLINSLEIISKFLYNYF